MSGASSSPNLTFVVTSRNDDHGGNLLSRMQFFLNGFCAQVKKHSLNAELILVEWNPPEDRPRLKDALSWHSSDSCILRIIEVPNKIHAKFKHSENLPLFQMIAKNVGIRRALGKFVLATNIDILFSHELMKFLKTGLKSGNMYRVNRFDVPFPPDATLDEQLRFCEQNVIRIAERGGTRNVLTGEYSLACPPETWRDILKDKLQEWQLQPVTRLSRLHTNASGDFTLMAKEHWFALRSYPEWEMYSFHLDSVLCHAAYHSGIREKVLKDPKRIYHIDHAEGSGWTPEGAEKLNSRLKKMSIPQMTNQELADLALQMRRERKPISYNDDDWGLIQYDLLEYKY